MRLASLLVAAASLLPAIATAGPLAVGVHLGTLQSRADADLGHDAQTGFGAFARYQLSPRIAGQVDLAKATLRDPLDDTSTSSTSFTASAVFDIIGESSLVPTAIVALGVEGASSEYYEGVARNAELGLGLEYRAKGGLIIGADVRAGSRALLSQSMVAIDVAEPYPMDYYEEYEGGNQPTSLQNGDYRAIRVFAALRFK